MQVHGGGDSSIEMLLVCKFMVGGLQYRGAVGMQVHGGGDSSIEVLLVCKFMVGETPV